MSRKGLGVISAVIFCPCHITLYGIILLLMGVSIATISTWLLPVMAALFGIGLMLIFIPSGDKSCRVKISNSKEWMQ